MNRIYLDNASTTKIDKSVIKAMSPYFSVLYGNASSLHHFGQPPFLALEKSREIIAKHFNCSAKEIIFTSSASESNNFALKGIAEEYRHRGKHLLICPIDHSSIVNTAQHLANLGYEVTWLKVDKYGLIDQTFLAKSIRPDTILVSIGYANNEIGTIQPIEKLVKIVKSQNQKTIFHTDAVQAVQYFNLNVKKLGVDLLSLTGHKFYAPKGIGLLYIKSGVALSKLIDGGQQEMSKRAGTENMPYIVGLAKAIQLLEKNQKKNYQKIKKLSDKLIKGIKEKIKDVELTGHLTDRLPHIINFIFKKIEGESIMLSLNQKGIAVSTGSACASHSLEPSHVLIGIGYPHELAHGSIRFSLGKDNTEKEIDYVLEVLPPIIKRLRQISPFK